MNLSIRTILLVFTLIISADLSFGQENPRLDSLLQRSKELYTIDPIKGFEVAEEARALSQDKYYYSKATTQMARALVGTTRKSETLELANEAIKIARENEFVRIEIEAINALGLYYYLKGLFQNATEYYHKALVLSEKYDEKELIIQQLNQIAIALIESGDYQQAESHLLEMRRLALISNDNRSIRVSYANMAYSLINQKRYSEALAPLEKYQELNKNTTELTSRIIEKNMLSKVYFGIQDYKKARGYIQEAIVLADDIGYVDGKVLTLKTLTELLYTTEDYDGAIHTANQIIELNEELGSDRFMSDSYYYLTKSYEQKGQYKMALTYTQKLLEQKEKSFNLDKERISESLEVQYELRSTEKEKEDLIELTKRSETIIKQRTLMAYGTLTAAGLLGFIIYLLNKNLKQRQKSNDLLESAVEKRTSELESSNKRLIQSNNELERFAFVASHDLKEPIRNLVSFSTLLSRQVENKETPSNEYLDIIRKNAKNVFILVEGILNFSRIRKVNFNFKHIEISAIIEDVKDLIDTTLKQRNAKVIHNTSGEISVDRAQFILVLKNIIENGIKYNQSAEPKITISNSSDTDCDYISIRDNGIGIEEEYQEEIFEMFKRLHNKNEYEGSGLGLSICNKIIQEHNGAIKVESNKGEGSTFIISLPRRISESMSSIL